MQELTAPAECEITSAEIERAIAAGDLAALAPHAGALLAREDVAVFSTEAVKLALRGAELCSRLVGPNIGGKDVAILLAKFLIRVDPQFDLYLTRRLPTDEKALAGAANGMTVEHVVRALEVLDVISPATRLVTNFAQLSRHPNPIIASKAMLVLGKRVQNTKWAERALRSPDPRVRANIVESFWNAGENAQALFRECLLDENNRVAGNAVFGLYLNGDRRFKTYLARLVGHESPGFRRTSCWIMGATRDPDFWAMLHKLSQDPSPDVQKSAKDALEQIRLEFDEHGAMPGAVARNGGGGRRKEANSRSRLYGDLLEMLRTMDRARKSILVGVDGLSKAGKTQFASQLAALGEDVVVVPTSDFAALTRSGSRSGVMIDMSLDIWRVREQLLDPLVSGGDARYEIPGTGKDEEAQWREIPAGRIVILEGLFALRQELRAIFDYRVWVEAPRTTRMGRLGSVGDSYEPSLWDEERLPKEAQYRKIHRPYDGANLIVDGRGHPGADAAAEYLIGVLGE